MEQSIRKKTTLNVVFNFISQAMTLIIPLITTPYLSRVLHEEGNGQYSFAVSIITYFILAANLGCDIYGQRQIAAHQSDYKEKSNVFWEIFIIKLVCTAISLIVLYSLLFTTGFGDKYTLLITILSIQVIAVPFDIQFLFRGLEKFKSIAIRTLVMKLIGLICIFLFVKTENDVWIYTLCISVSTILSNLLLWISIRKNVGFVSIKDLHFLKHIKPIIIIFLPTLAFTIYTVFDRTMIGLLAPNPEYENGCYEQAYKLNNIIMLFITVMSSVFVSRNSVDYKSGNIESLKNNLKFSINYVWFIGIPLLFGTIVMSKSISSWFFGEGYEIVPLLLIIMGTRYLTSGLGDVLGNQLFVVIQKEKYTLIAVFTAAIFNVVLNYFLIKEYGAIGAAISTAISELIVTLIFVFFAIKNKYLNLADIFIHFFKPLISSVIMLVPIYFLNDIFPYSIWSFILIVFIGIIIYVSCNIILKEKTTLFLWKAFTKKIGGLKNDKQ